MGLSLRPSAIVTLSMVAGPWTAGGQTPIDEVAATEMNRLRTAVAAGLYWDGGIAFLDAWGTPARSDSTALTPEHLFAFDGFTEVLLATTIRALGVAGALDLDAPIGSFAPALADRLHPITLRQLLEHTSGLDDAVLLEHQSWADAAAKLPNEALFTEPGLVFSQSRYSYPLAAHVVERNLGGSIGQIIAAVLTEPLGMRRTVFDAPAAIALGMATGYRFGDEEQGEPEVVEVDPAPGPRGLPLAYTSATDVLRFVNALLTDAIPGGLPTGEVAEAALPTAGPRWAGGFEEESYRGVSSLTLRAGSFGFGATLRILPESGTATIGWANGSYPAATMRFIEQQIADRVGLEAPGPPGPRSDPDPLPDPEDWVGTYRNGEYIVELANENGSFTYFDGERHLEVVGVEGPVLGARIDDGRIVVRFELMEIAGRRFVHLAGKAYQLQPPE